MAALMESVVTSLPLTTATRMVVEPVAHGHALGGADQLLVQLGDYQADGLGGAGGVGHDVLGAGTGTTEVTLAMGAVQDHLVAGVGVHGGHDTALHGISVHFRALAMGARQLVVQLAAEMI